MHEGQKPPMQDALVTTEHKDTPPIDIFIHEQVLYHGHAFQNEEQLQPAQETTLGSGIYLTSNRADAEGYALTRARESKPEKPLTPKVFTVTVKEVRLADLRVDEHVSTVMRGFREQLAQRLKNLPANSPWYITHSLQETIANIDSGKVTGHTLQWGVQGQGGLFTEYMKSLGYDGLVSIEGGEGEVLRNHDTWLIFDPTKTTIDTIDSK